MGDLWLCAGGKEARHRGFKLRLAMSGYAFSSEYWHARHAALVLDIPYCGTTTAARAARVSPWRNAHRPHPCSVRHQPENGGSAVFPWIRKLTDFEKPPWVKKFHVFIFSQKRTSSGLKQEVSKHASPAFVS